MVYLAAVSAAAALGLGWVLQQQVASEVDLSKLLSVRMLLDLMHSKVWWAGIGAMTVGQTLAGFALQLGPVTAVGPLLAANLLFAFAIRAITGRARARMPELIGAVLLCAAVGVFLGVADPHKSQSGDTTWTPLLATTAALTAGVGLMVIVGMRRGLLVESILTATGAGVLYGMQDASTRGALLSASNRGLDALPRTPWPYLLLASAIIGVLLSQSAFRAARLDYSLPPITVAEPIVAVVLGVTLLGDKVATTRGSLIVESLCVVAMIAAAVLIGQSQVLKYPHGMHISRSSRGRHGSRLDNSGEPAPTHPR